MQSGLSVIWKTPPQRVIWLLPFDWGLSRLVYLSKRPTSQDPLGDNGLREILKAAFVLPCGDLWTE